MYSVDADIIDFSFFFFFLAMALILHVTQSSIRKEWASQFSEHNLNAYSALPLLINPTHYVGDTAWFSDTEPPMEVLEKIRTRKLEKKVETQTRQDKLKKQAQKRQIEEMQRKLKPKAEL